MWSQLGNEVSLLGYTRDQEVVDALAAANLPCRVVIKALPIKAPPLLDGRFKALKQLAASVVSSCPDVIYTRRDVYYPQVSELARHFPLVVEINSDEVVELKERSTIRWLYHLATRRFADREVSGFVFVTEELKKHSYYLRLGKAAAVVSNGIALDDYKSLPAPANRCPHLVFVGVPSAWHGIDKIMLIASLFPEWDFDLIGVSRSDVAGAIPQNVRVHGSLPRREYEEILARSDVAIGSLALYRNGMTEACPLKVREYLAFGLPVITAYRDTDFPEGAPFICQLPNSVDNVIPYRTRIAAFVNAWMGSRVARDSIQHLDIKWKERERLDFLQAVAHGGPDGGWGRS